MIPWGRRLWLYHSLYPIPHPLWSTGCLWRESGHRRCAWCCSSSRWKCLECCAEAGEDKYAEELSSTFRVSFPNYKLLYCKMLSGRFKFWAKRRTELNLYLISKKTKLLQEVLCHLEFVSDCVLLHLSPDLFGLLGHAVLQVGTWKLLWFRANLLKLHRKSSALQTPCLFSNPYAIESLIICDFSLQFSATLWQPSETTCALCSSAILLFLISIVYLLQTCMQYRSFFTFSVRKQTFQASVMHLLY